MDWVGRALRGLVSTTVPRGVAGVEGGVSRRLPDGAHHSNLDATAHAHDGAPLIVLAGTDYGSESSRDWAAKGSLLLGVKAVLATSFERIDRANLIGMEILALLFDPGQSARGLGLTGEEPHTITAMTATRFRGTVRIDTLAEAVCYRHGGSRLRPAPASPS
jgi:aconitate hydratase